PRLQIQNQRPHPHPPNLLHQVPHLLKHSAYLPVPPLNQNHFVPRILPILKKPYFRRRSLHVSPILQLNHNSRPQPRNSLFIRLPAHLHQIRLWHVRASLHHPLRQRAIIREQQQSLASVVQPPHRIHAPHTLPHNIHHRRPPFRIAHRRHIPLRLVHHEVEQLLWPRNRGSIHTNRVGRKIRLRPQFAHHGAIHRHAPRQNYFFRLAPRRHPASRHYFLESLLHVSGDC